VSVDKMTNKDIVDYIESMAGAFLDYPFGEKVAVYKLGDENGKMFALLNEDADPLRISLKCDPTLAELLRERYETVLPGYHLSKKHWNTIICSGRVPDDELRDLIRHSHELVKKG